MLGPILGPSWARLRPMLGHLGSKLGPRWVVLGASWAMLRHFGALREAPGRHLEAKAGLGSIDLEPTCGKKATSQNLPKANEKTYVFQLSLEAGRSRKHAKMALWRSGCGLDGHLAGLESHAVVSGAAGSQHHHCLGPFCAHLGLMLGPLGAKLGPRWVLLGASWAMLRHFGALREAPGRHLEANSRSWKH